MPDKRITHAFGWELDKGLKRSNNEDSLGAAKIKQASEGASRSVGVYMVADGVGGSAGGEEASKLAVETSMQKMLVRISQEANEAAITRWLSNAAQVAHRLIRQRKADDEEIGSTTLVMAVVIEDRVHIVNIGDSRAYIISDRQLRQVTQDHTVSRQFVEAGVISEEEAVDHPFSHILSQAVGSDTDLTPDVYSETVHPGDYLLLCSDGLYNTVDSKKILRIVLSAKTPQQASQKLIKAANKGGGDDNIAVVTVAIRERD